MDQPSPFSLAPEVRAVIERYHSLLHEVLPGRIEGLYLVGSVALGDYQAGRSDVDFVAVTRDTLAVQELDRLEEIHDGLRTDIRRPWFDGIYVTWDDLRRDPTDLKSVPFTHEGRFERTRGFEANPSTWLTLHNHPHALWGPASPRVWHDLAAVRQWNVENLSSYWRRQLARMRGIVRATIMMTSTRAMNTAIAWCVPGVSRLHYTITTGDVTSKSGACRYALTTFPDRWHPIIQEALAVRNGDRLSARRRGALWRDLVDYMEFVISDANA